MTLKSKKESYVPLNDTNAYFYSYDIGLVAALLCQNYQLVSLDKAVKNKVLFIVRRADGIDEAVRKYWDFQLPVDAQMYFNQLKRVKNQIYSD